MGVRPGLHGRNPARSPSHLVRATRLRCVALICNRQAHVGSGLRPPAVLLAGQCQARQRMTREVLSACKQGAGAPSAAAALLQGVILHRRTSDRAVGTVDATVAGLRAQHLATALALLEPLAGIGGHRLGLDMTAARAGQGGRGHAGGRAGFGFQFLVHEANVKSLDDTAWPRKSGQTDKCRKCS
jgi:hypothetical protein